MADLIISLANGAILVSGLVLAVLLIAVFGLMRACAAEGAD